MYQEPLVLYFVVGAIAVVVSGLAMAALRQPMITGYILAGFVLGPHGVGLVQDQTTVAQLGAVGVVLLLFFIGLDVSPRQMIRNWRVALIGTSLQVMISMALVGLLGAVFDWPLARTVLIGMVISLSCTAVVIDHLARRGQLETRVARDTLVILIAQDIFVIPMMVLLGLLGGEGVDGKTLALQCVGGLLIVGLVAWAITRERVELPLVRRLSAQREMQVFVSLLLCFGLAFMSGVMQLSTALGAFAAGLIVGQTRDVEWIRGHLDALRVVFVAIFFASIGMLIDIHVLSEYWRELVILVWLVFVTNTLLNAGILRFLGRTWPESLYAGALLAHVGEFSFVLAAIGLHAGIVGLVAYQMTVAAIAISLALGPAWAMLVERFLPAGWSQSLRPADHGPSP